MDLNTFNHFCDKFNKETPHTKSRATQNWGTHALYDWLRLGNRHAFEESKYAFVDVPDDLDTTSEFALSVCYHYFLDDCNYMFSSRKTTWNYHGNSNSLIEIT